jgi:hypothetical protein
MLYVALTSILQFYLPTRKISTLPQNINTAHRLFSTLLLGHNLLSTDFMPKKSRAHILRSPNYCRTASDLNLLGRDY